MSTLERLMATADEETWDLVWRFIGKETLALHLAKALASSMNAKISAEAVAEVFGIEVESARNKINRTEILK